LQIYKIFATFPILQTRQVCPLSAKPPYHCALREFFMPVKIKNGRFCALRFIFFPVKITWTLNTSGHYATEACAKNEPQPVRLTSDSSFLVMLRMPNSLQTDDVMLLRSTAHCTNLPTCPFLPMAISDIALQFIQSPVNRRRIVAFGRRSRPWLREREGPKLAWEG